MLVDRRIRLLPFALFGCKALPREHGARSRSCCGPTGEDRAGAGGSRGSGDETRVLWYLRVCFKKKWQNPEVVPYPIVALLNCTVSCHVFSQSILPSRHEKRIWGFRATMSCGRRSNAPARLIVCLCVCAREVPILDSRRKSVISRESSVLTYLS